MFNVRSFLAEFSPKTFNTFNIFNIPPCFEHFFGGHQTHSTYLTFPLFNAIFETKGWISHVLWALVHERGEMLNVWCFLTSTRVLKQCLRSMWSVATENTIKTRALPKKPFFPLIKGHSRHFSKRRAVFSLHLFSAIFMIKLGKIRILAFCGAADVSVATYI